MYAFELLGKAKSLNAVRNRKVEISLRMIYAEIKAISNLLVLLIVLRIVNNA